MKVDLSKDDLVHLVCGIEPNFNVFLIAEKYGTYVDAYSRWTWNRAELSKLSEEELYKFYIELAYEEE